MYAAILLLLAAAAGAGFLGAFLRSWSFHSRLYALENALAVVEGTLQREVKARAAGERWKKKDLLDETIEAAVIDQGLAEKRKPQFWWQKYTKELPPVEGAR